MPCSSRAPGPGLSLPRLNSMVCIGTGPAAGSSNRWMLHRCCRSFQQHPRHSLQHASHAIVPAMCLAATAAGGSCGQQLPCSQVPRSASMHSSHCCTHECRAAPSFLCTRKGSAWSATRRRSAGPCPASLVLVEPATAATAAAAAASAATHSAAALNFSKVLAVALGYAVLAGSLFRSVPQIVKVMKLSSTEGLSLTSYVVELCCYSVVIAYNISQGYGFNTFGEVCACWAQDIILIALIFRFNKTPIWAVGVTALLIALGCCYLLSPACPHHVLAALQASTIATMALGSRLPQILLNMRRGNAGVLSVTSCMLNVAGNSARIFTTLVLTGDMLLLSGALTQGCLNTVLLCQSITTAKARRSQAADLAGSEVVGTSGLQAQMEPQKQQQEVPSAAIDPGSSSLVVPAPA